jgi:hypothetical protein
MDLDNPPSSPPLLSEPEMPEPRETTHSLDQDSMDIVDEPATTSPINIPSSPDPLNSSGMDFAPPSTATKKTKGYPTKASIVPQKRATQDTTLDTPRLPPPRTPFTFVGQPMPMPEPKTAEEALAMARTLIVKATALTLIPEKQTLLLDFLEVFRDFTENSRVNKHGLSALASQVSSLETVSRAIGTKVRQLQKPALATNTTATGSQPPLPQPNLVLPTVPASSYAAAAARAQPTASSWQQVGKKKTTTPPPPKNSLSSRQLVLIQDNPQPFNSLSLRNAFNQAFASKGVKSPVVASVTSSKKENIVLTTTPAFTAKYLLEKQDIWEPLIQFKNAQLIQPWYKVAIHNIPTSYVSNESLSILKSEITTFNKGFEIVGQPYWLTREEKRMQQPTGSVCIAFATEQEAQRAIRNKLYLLGISARVEKLHSTPASTQCPRCQRFGHLEARCSNTIACKLCAELHPTRLHKCNTCSTKGKTCLHTVPLCVNCKGAHPADSKMCDTYLATLHPRQASFEQMYTNESTIPYASIPV